MKPMPNLEPQMILTSKKRHRSGSSSCLSSIAATIDSDYRDQTLIVMESSQSQKPRWTSISAAAGFNDPSSADVLLHLYHLDDSNSPSSAPAGDGDSFDEVQIYLHSSVISRAKYFSALLSDRWCKDDRTRFQKVNLSISPNSGSIQARLTVLQLLCTDDFSTVIHFASAAISILAVALKLLFEDCVEHCVRFLKAVLWSKEEGDEILNLAPFLSEDESKELLARASTPRPDSCERMLHNLLLSAKQNHLNMASMKAFVARLLREFSSRDSARRVLKKAFTASLKVVKDSLEEYSSPKIRGDYNETEAIQRLNLHTALTNAKHLLWLIERMIDLRVADMAVKEWSEQDSLAVDLQRAFRDDAWRNIVLGLPTIMLKCTSKLASYVAAGTILVARQVYVVFWAVW
ncbi:hypothetical protein Cgig2_032510 [Carnegiea gigantea]|uniref:BTB/POZ domain-containing protein n=1 Tax=Carnegiea gigantea TaxID=171969 RepID=A0A9Q1QSP3_9CARY|nr:hypothetical protein Cgig2_032510 [Carnegiea gigantea]